MNTQAAITVSRIKAARKGVLRALDKIRVLQLAGHPEKVAFGLRIAADRLSDVDQILLTTQTNAEDAGRGKPWHS
jgi:hypothetical protein